MSKLKVNSIEHVAANGQALQIAPSGGVGIVTDNVTRASLVGAASSLVGLYIGDGSILFNKNLNRTTGYYISTEVNALNAGPVSLGSTMTLDGTWVIVQYRRIMGTLNLGGGASFTGGSSGFLADAPSGTVIK